MRDRRAVFFAIASIMCFALTPLAEARFRNLTLAVGTVYLLLALASYLDFRSRQ